MMPGRGGFRPPPQLQPSGPSVQEIEQMMDQALTGVLEQCKAMFEARVVSLENLVEQQQAQIQQLQNLSEVESRLSRLAHEVSSLHLDHSVLKDDCQATAECLLSAGALQVPQLTERRQICKSLSVFRSMMETREGEQSMKSLLGGQGAEVTRLFNTSRSFSQIRKTIAEKAPAAVSTVEDLDDRVFQELKAFEPSRSDLDKWEKSVTVNTIMGSFKVDGIIGITDNLKFTDVYKIFTHLGLTLDQFVDKFTKVQRSRSAEDLEQMANKILKKFSSDPAEGKIRCRDIYRLLEIIGYSLPRFKSIYTGSDEPDPATQSLQKLGGYRLRREIGQGRNSVIYWGEHVSDQTRVAVKWPAPREELQVRKDLQRAAPKGCLGLPKLLAHGDSQKEPYFVTEMFGPPLSQIFERLDGSTAERRWSVLKVVGRLVLRRLRALHELGFVHCDVSPGNIVLGKGRADSEKGGKGEKGSQGGPQLALYLVDLEHAQRFPGGRKLETDCGSAEWSSIRSADGDERLPADDVEALGWVLLNGLLGDLPWFPWLTAAYKDWDSRWTRLHVVRQVKSAKMTFLKGGWKSFSCRKSVKTPDELVSFMTACSTEESAPGPPDYASLIELLGGSKELDSEQVEQEDLSELMAELLAL